MGLTEVSAPVTATDGNDGELGEDDGTADSSRDLLRALDTETDVAVEVADSDERLEARALTGTGLLLDGFDLYFEKFVSNHRSPTRSMTILRPVSPLGFCSHAIDFSPLSGGCSSYLHDLILELGQEEVDDLEFLDGKREEVDFLHGFYLAILDETAELGDGNPRQISRYIHQQIRRNAYHSFSSSLRPPRRGPRRPRPRSPRPRPNPPRPRPASAIVYC